MTDFVLEAELREKTGKAETRRLRRLGKLPAIIYGGDKPDTPILLDQNDTSKLLKDEHFFTSIIEINVKGSRGKNSVLLKDSQWDPIYDTAKHLDFFRVSSSDTVHVEVPVVAINHEKCPGSVAGGLLDVVRHSLEVTSRADSIPEHIEVDCSNLEIGDSIHIDDITLPEGAEIVHDVNFTVINMAAPKKAEPEADAAVEGETVVEGSEDATEATEE
ncbi:MAG TPA: 50S ribosomal protein L25/general stress protein Ctc [Mariprofundaceae bacterium]|nr:50S ribosomal protein L25/general stress protein Ctc [Mariprofundaceae bacterium]